jgi:hypothetical protein
LTILNLMLVLPLGASLLSFVGGACGGGRPGPSGGAGGSSGAGGAKAGAGAGGAGGSATGLGGSGGGGAGGDSGSQSGSGGVGGGSADGSATGLGGSGGGGAGGELAGSGGSGSSGASGGAGASGQVGVSYAGCSFLGNIERIVVAKRDAGRNLCVNLVFSNGTNTSQIRLPQGWKVEFAFTLPGVTTCPLRFPPATRVQAMGVSGSATWSRGTSRPYVDVSVDATLTFPGGDAGLGTTERLMVTGVDVASGC